MTRSSTLTAKHITARPEPLPHSPSAEHPTTPHHATTLPGNPGAARARRSWATEGALLAAVAAPTAMGVSGPSLALPAVAEALHATPSSAAWLMTAYGLGMAAGTPLLSATAGRRGPRRLLLAGAALIVLGVLIVLATRSLPVLVIGRTVEAAGAAGLNIAAFQLAGRPTRGDGGPDPRRAGRIAGLVSIGSAAGGTTGLFAGAVIAQAVHWQLTLVLPLLGLLAIPAVLRLAGPPAATPAQRSGLLPRDVLRERPFRRAAALMLAVSTVNFALVYAAPRRIAALTGWSQVHTGAVAAVTALAGALLSWTLIRSAPALGRRRTDTLIAAGSLVATALAAFGPWAAVVVLGSSLSALVTSAGQAVLNGAAAEGLPPERHGPAIGLFNLAFLLGVAAGPALASLAYQTVQFIY
ncbi:MFS transporter [Kitasatospora sp. NPDC050543]|uniref:MFS transporter n=1 Tax=Kitasatospora sp. NPDC050543 TaxID=3364054 RepID=UPI003798DC74